MALGGEFYHPKTFSQFWGTFWLLFSIFRKNPRGAGFTPEPASRDAGSGVKPAPPYAVSNRAEFFVVKQFPSFPLNLENKERLKAKEPYFLSPPPKPYFLSPPPRRIFLPP
jgi:hypothetical protein